jgi:hypothetical protein
VRNSRKDANLLLLWVKESRLKAGVVTGSCVTFLVIILFFPCGVGSTQMHSLPSLIHPKVQVFVNISFKKEANI